MNFVPCFGKKDYGLDSFEDSYGDKEQLETNIPLFHVCKLALEVFISGK